MGISKKGFHKIVKNKRTFYWCIRNDNEDDNRLYLVIQSDNKQFSVSYMLGQWDKERHFSPINPYIIVKGKEFKGLNNLGRIWECFLVPYWEEPASIKSSFVAAILDWCLIPEEVTSVNYIGEILPSRRII